MNQVRSRSRIATAASGGGQAAAPRQGTGDTSWMKTGDAADVAREAEVQRQKRLAEERAKNSRMPFRFYLKQGEEADIIILDDTLPPCIYEHQHWNPATKKATQEACPSEWENCPLCDGVGGFNGKTYVQFFSIIDMRQVTIQKGPRAGTVLPFTRKLLPVKLEQQGFFKRLAERNGGKLRGAHILMTRDSQTGANIGTPEFVEWVSNEDIMAEFSSPEVKNEKGEVIKEANADCFPYNYGVLFPKPSGADLRSRYGGSAPAGSREEQRNEWGDDNLDPGEAETSTSDGGTGDGSIRSGSIRSNGGNGGGGGISRRSSHVDTSGDPDDVPL